MENRGNREIILPQRAQRAQKLMDQGKPGKPRNIRRRSEAVAGRGGATSRELGKLSNGL
jgi:hypothetical protein